MSAAVRKEDSVNKIIPINDVKHDMGGPELTFERSQFGRADSLRYAILNLVADGAYEVAVRELKLYHSSKPEYPTFEERTERFVGFAIDLINAIRTKRNFPGHSLLRRAKKQELTERVKEHFSELKQTLMKIENIEVELRVEDLRSTVWVLQSVVYSSALVFLVALVLDVFHYNLLYSVFYVFSDWFSQITNWLIG